MRIVKKTTWLVCLSLLALLTSCSTWDGNVGTTKLVDPQVTRLDDDGKHVWVNVGLLDDVRAGAMLWVVRDKSITAILSVRGPKDYSARCLIIGSKSLDNLAATKGVKPGDPAVGDRVARKFLDVWRGSNITNRVARFVTVRTDAEELDADVDAVLSPEGRAKKERLKKIPREEYEEWKRTHLPPPPPDGQGE